MKALIITGKYCQDIEFFYPLYRLNEEGWDVEVMTEGNQAVSGVYGMTIKPTALTGNQDVLILPGGARALEYLRQNSTIIEIIKDFYRSQKVIGAICHGTQLLISAGLVKGKQISGYYSIKDDINNAGGAFVDAPFVISDWIVTSPHYKYLGLWVKEVIKQAYINHDAKSV